MSSTDRTWETPASFAERIWPVIDVYGRLRPLLGTDEHATAPGVGRGRSPRGGVFAIA